MNINIEKYVSEEEIKEIVKEELAYEIRRKLEKNDIERILSNTAYMVVFKEIDKIIGASCIDIIKEKVVKNLKEEKIYGIFRAKDNWNEASIGQKILEETVMSNKQLINNRVLEVLNSIDKELLTDILNDLIYKVIEDRILGK